MDLIERTLRRLSATTVFVAGLLLILSACYVTVEVLARKLFSVALYGANELSSYALAVCGAWAFAYALLERGHIRIDFLYRFVSARAGAAVDLMALVAIAGFGGVLVVYGWGVLGFAITIGQRSNTPLGTPMWIPMGLWFAGLSMFLAVAMFLILRCGAALARGDLAEVKRLAGPPAVDEGVGAVAAEIGERAGAALGRDTLR